MSPATPVSPPDLRTLAAAARHHRDGRLGQAEALYRELLAQDSLSPEALCGLAAIALDVGRGAIALPLLERATIRRGGDAALWNQIGAARFGLADLVGARDALRCALSLAPDAAPCHYHLGVVEREAGQEAAAMRSFRHAGRIEPLHPFALSDLAVLLHAKGQAAAGEAALRTLLALDPARTIAWHNYGLLLGGLGRAVEEERVYAHAIAIDPFYVEPRYNAGCLALAERQFTIASNHLATVLAIDPANSRAWNNFGCARREQGMMSAAINAFARGCRVAADDRDLPSNLLMALSAHDGAAADIAARDWGARFPPAATWPPRSARGRRLRVGYLSPDLRHHSCAYFLTPLLATHDQDVVEVFVYADVAAPDAVTASLRTMVERWRDVAHLGDVALASQIAADDLDILVDLAGHTSANRLRVFAMKPARIQVSWLGYNATTGLREVDWKLVDRWTRPAQDAEWFAEGLWPLDRLAHCWRPPLDTPEPAAGRADGPTTFGSFNALHKLSDDTLGLWADILARVRGAQLRLKGGAGDDPMARRRIVDTMARHGIPADQIIIDGWASATGSHLAQYGDIDIALDPFPYNGTTTTCEALWMGVPVITLAGQRMLSRIGVSLLATAGLDDLVAADRQDYVEIATRLAGDTTRLKTLRRELRDRVAGSALRDEAGFSRSLEDAFNRMVRGYPPA